MMEQERKAVLDGFRDGRFKALVANQVLDEGIDVPAVKVGCQCSSAGAGSPPAQP